MGSPGKETTLYYDNIKTLLTCKMCQPFFSELCFLFPLPLSTLSCTSPLILSICAALPIQLPSALNITKRKIPFESFCKNSLVSVYFFLSCPMFLFPNNDEIYVASCGVFLSVQSVWPSCCRPLKIHLSLSPPLSSLFKHTAVTCLLCPVPPVI